MVESVYGSPWPPLDDRTSSLRSLDQACGWLTSCCVQHPSCSALSKSEQWLPTRLIDIGSEGDDSWKLRVVAEDGLHTPAPYIALSYRWGAEPSIMLLKSNMDEFRRGQYITDFPQTFQDLVTVARHFSVRYVWIDALCIIQDSSQDWVSESATMRYVYANSLCTIAASASSSPEGGLFRSRQPEQARPAVVKIAFGDKAPEDFYIWDSEYWLSHFGRSELHSRGWTFQERFLSPRVLSFGHDQIMWECMTDHKCEGFPGGVPSHESEKSYYPLSKLRAPRQDDQRPLFSERTFQTWISLAEGYSKCSLTKPTDKLVAFAGIAKLFQENTGDEYVAGLWKSRLVQMLDWTVTTPGPGAVDYLAPSWSWAPVQSSIKIEYRPTVWPNVNLVSVRAIESINREADPTVGVSYGCIRLHGALFPAQWDRPPVSIRIHMAPHVAEVYLDTSPGNWGGKRCLFLLPIILHPFENETGRCLIDYLILEKHSTGTPDIYQRIGCCRTDQYVKGFDRIFKDEDVGKTIFEEEGFDQAIFGIKAQFSDISIV